MNPAQIRKYRLVWGKVRRLLRERGLSAKDADARRHQIHVKALGSDKSSLDFTNRDFDKVLSHFIAILEPDNLEAQIRIIEQPELRRARMIELCRELVGGLPQIADAVNPEFYASNYLDALAKRVRGRPFESLDEAGLGVIHGILVNRLGPKGPAERDDPF
ncbi:MAG: hypothetical protein KF715_08415 [Candidatus Didemnitutus sp.]|nr:hypothetical protein [Candidatus Didemnitutus sp.]